MGFSETHLTVLWVGRDEGSAHAVLVCLRQLSTIKVAVRVCSPADVSFALENKQPSVLVLDADFATQDCCDLARAMRHSYSQCRIMFVSEEIEDEYVQLTLEVGAYAYLAKREPASAVVTAIQEVASGRTVFSREVMERLVFHRDGAAASVRPANRIELLTPREVEIASYIAQGLTDKEIGRRANISSKTVEAHNAHIRNKLGVRGRVDIARYAIREGLVVC